MVLLRSQEQGELSTHELFSHASSFIKGWKAQFFYVKNTGFPPLTWREETQVSDPIPSLLPAAELDRLISSGARLKVKEFNNAQLWSAGLIRSGVNDSAPDLRPLIPEELAACKFLISSPLPPLFFMSLASLSERPSSLSCSEEIFPTVEHKRNWQFEHACY